MSDTESPEGWVPAIGHGVTLEEVVERAFDYRGNVTVVKADGTRLEGYVFNRNRDVEVPFIQVFDRAVPAPWTSPTPTSARSCSPARTRRPATRTRPGSAPRKPRNSVSALRSPRARDARRRLHRSRPRSPEPRAPARARARRPSRVAALPD